jgi:hypothetical protein
LDVIELDDSVTRGAGRTYATPSGAKKEDEDESDHADENQGEPALTFAERIEHYRPL